MSPAKVQCPTCGKPVVWRPENSFRPFCSDRCRLIDLGAWAKEEYQIPAEPDYDDLNSEDLDSDRPIH